MPEIPKAYEPQAVEKRWYAFWLAEGCFTADPASSKPPYSIVIPPPNITGMLHMGHVLNNTIQDILARKARMEGKEVLWLPGTDHASIATHAVLEKTLRKQGLMKHRDDLGREKFLEHAWAWKATHGSIIVEQLKRLGCSCDWSRERFTMDPAYSRCVHLVFFELYRKGLIYQGKRMVNWDPIARTALSDEEVEMTEEKGRLWHLKYPLLDSRGQTSADEFVVVATTRPETMLGDEAVAVNPQDPRYSALVGRRCWLPLRNKAIPLIADDFVDPKFGTGCVKVTPAHDPNDYQMGQRHKLPLTIVIGPDGLMTPEAGEDFAGMDRLEARKAVVEKLHEQKLLLKTEDYTHNVGYSQRSGVPIEPYLSEQWFLKYPSVNPARACVADGVMKFHPERWVKVYDYWMAGLQDWCISRQLWWGHRVPVWTPDSRTTPTATLEIERYLLEQQNAYPELVAYRREPIGPPTLGRDAQPAMPPFRSVVCLGPGAEHISAKIEAAGWRQDPDVLDTWFSSWLWPFATMGWPERTDTLQRFYPTSDLVTGPDIIFFWVARMIMAGYEFMGAPAFKNVYFTGIIRDKLGRKMSKSLGNSPDPLALIDKYGADALRFGTMRSAPLGQDVLFDEKDVELGRNFCNKLWNACRFRQLQGGQVQGEIDPNFLSGYDKWILLKLDLAISEISQAFADYRFNEATQTLYRFFWSEYCDWYVEACKAVLTGPAESATTVESKNATPNPRRANTLAVLDFVLSHTLRLFHPFLPFITEELWHDMGYHQDMPADQGGKTILFAPWPKPLGPEFLAHYGLDPHWLETVGARFALVTQARNLRREANVPANKKVRFVFKPLAPWPAEDLEVLRLLLNAEAVELPQNFEAPKGTPAVHSELGALYLPLEGLVDVEAEKARLKKGLEKAQAEIEKVSQKLNNPAFTQKVPAHVLAEHQKRRAEWEGERERLEAALQKLTN